MAQYGKKAQTKVGKVMREMKEGKLKSGNSNKKVTSRKQAIAIGLSEARKAGGKIPAPKTFAKKSATSKPIAKKSTAAKPAKTAASSKPVAKKISASKKMVSKTTGKMAAKTSAAKKASSPKVVAKKTAASTRTAIAKKSAPAKGVSKAATAKKAPVAKSKVSPASMIRKAHTAAVKSVPAKKNPKSAKKDESMLTQMEEAVESGAKAVMNAAVGLFDYVEEGLGMKPAKKKGK